ncbi:hypothetical protein [Curtobacterium sp. MCPF17_052]|uniref:hypothetical protein n=1 Tax=Curtobacterium sp. MCPF17_052 TaxID=2175655 RepID=UPI0024DFCD5E|nr:hypothetical protein [Curtobacterium sp. MCPF17_052]WIB12073.1 hypothetical protein DEJ36_14935 [Curtobacterium sp. MCPF17_052]
MSAGTTGNDDVYSTSDATWTADADDDGTTVALGTGDDDHDDTGGHGCVRRARG